MLFLKIFKKFLQKLLWCNFSKIVVYQICLFSRSFRNTFGQLLLKLSLNILFMLILYDTGFNYWKLQKCVFSPIYRKNLLVFNFLVTKVFGMFISSSYLAAFKLSTFKRVYCCSLTTANYLFFDGCFFFLPKCSFFGKICISQIGKLRNSSFYQKELL